MGAKAFCLETMFSPEDHTAEHILEFFENMPQEWNITDGKLSTITADNAVNMKKSFHDQPYVWLGCFGHNLNLAIAKALKIQKVDTAVSECRHLLQGFSRSWKRKRELKKHQATLEVPEKSHIHDVVKRWGSTFKMIERFLEQQQACCAVLVADRSLWHLMPKDNDVQTLERVCQLPGPLSDFTDLLGSETKTTLSSLKPVMEHITNLLNENEGDDALTKQIKKVMIDDLQQRYSCERVKKVIDIACFTDPHIKDNFSQNKDDIIKSAEEEAVNLAGHTILLPLEESTATTAAKKKDKSLSSLLKKITLAKHQRVEAEDASPKERVKMEIKQYVFMLPYPLMLTQWHDGRLTWKTYLSLAV